MFGSEGAADTVPPHDPVSICFSKPLDKTAEPRLEISPAFADYYTVLSASRDTLTVVHTLPFPGSARIVIRLAAEVVSDDGSVLRAGQDSVVLLTYPLEKEPNGTVAAADTLAPVVFGSLSVVNDTDWFVVTGPVALVAFGLTSLQADAVAFDAAGTSWRPDSTDTIRIDSGFIAPVHLRVSSRAHSSGGYYRLQALAGHRTHEETAGL